MTERRLVEIGGSPALTRGARLFDLALAAILAAVLLPSGLGAVADTRLTGVWAVLLPLDLVVLHGALAFRRSRLTASFLVVSGAMAVLVLAPDVLVTAGDKTSGISALLLPTSMVFFFSLEAVTAYGTFPLPLAGLAIGALGGALSMVRLWNAPASGNPVTGAVPWRLLLVGVVIAGLTAAWALGRYRATRVAWIEALEERALRAEAARHEAIERARVQLEVGAAQAAAAERRRIAREMHDVIAHSLAVVVSHAEAGRLLVKKQPEQALEVFTTIAAVGRDALTEMRGLLGLLRDESGESSRDVSGDGPRDGSGDATGHTAGENESETRPGPQPSLRQLDALVETVCSAGTPVELSVTGRPGKLSPTSDLTAYRVIQEALTNVVKHAGPGAGARLQLTWAPHRLEIVVSDDGREAGPVAVAGRGITGMRERLEHVGGTLVHAGRVADGDSFTVHAWIPRSDNHAGEGEP